MPDVRRIVKIPWIVEAIREHSESIKFALKLIGCFVLYALIYYGLSPVFEMWHIWGALAGAPVLFGLTYYLLKPAPIFIIEVQLRPTTIAIYKIGPDRLARMKFEGDLNLRFRSRKGVQIIVCEHVDWDKNIIRLAWTHQLSSLEFLAYVTVFNHARELAKRYADRLAILEKDLTLAVKALKAELIAQTTSDIDEMARLPKIEHEEAAQPAPPVAPQPGQGAGGEEGEQPEGEAPSA